MTEDFNPSDWLTTKEAAELTDYSSVTFRQFAREGRIEAKKRGRDWFLHKESVLEYVNEMEELGSNKHNPRRKVKNG